jgi:hypothetical protein
MNATEFKPTLRGKHARLKDDGSQVFVVNHTAEAKFKDGTTGPAYKVRIATYAGVDGWNGGAGKTVYSYGKPFWTKASNVTA